MTAAADADADAARRLLLLLLLLRDDCCYPPLMQAANAYLKQRLGPGYGARLVGVKDMPRAASHLSLDFSSLLGPLFLMWQVLAFLPPVGGRPGHP